MFFREAFSISANFTCVIVIVKMNKIYGTFWKTYGNVMNWGKINLRYFLIFKRFFKTLNDQRQTYSRWLVPLQCFWSFCFNTGWAGSICYFFNHNDRPRIDNNFQEKQKDRVDERKKYIFWKHKSKVLQQPSITM